MLPQFKATDVSAVEVSCAIFKDFSVCVLNFDAAVATKEALETMVAALGGACVQSPVKG